jgi:hypothetical protein
MDADEFLLADGTTPEAEEATPNTLKLYHLSYRAENNERSAKAVLLNEESQSYLVMRRDFMEVLNSCKWPHTRTQRSRRQFSHISLTCGRRRPRALGHGLFRHFYIAARWCPPPRPPGGRRRRDVLQPLRAS